MGVGDGEWQPYTSTVINIIQFQSLLDEARDLLLSLSKSGDHARLFEHHGSRQNVEGRLSCCFKLAKSLHRSIVEGLGPSPDSPDWVVVKSVFELVVRWGIYLYLSVGVGISLENRFQRSAAVAAAAAFLHKQCMDL
ncbi:hypothetical protein O6H91_16G020900 [Diphasiastrum complanatum]|uniref:Uncharacterized protein n=1 Tax=Diphasiastrum complanatum TaxID=34168 RepID=A0ACC2BAD0_DIPCM|nr:hypothetical protein O6H91_16G020900 [Diphasiastrum complanatum]